MIRRYVPAGTAAAAGAAPGTYGVEALPAVLAQRRQNRGFEAVAFQDGKLYAFVQSPLRNPSSSSNANLNGWKHIRIIEFNTATETTTGQYVYIMDNAAPQSPADSRADKIGDAVAMGNGEFLVLERDDDAIDSDPVSDIQKKIYRFELAGATNINSLPNIFPNGKTVEQMTPAELSASGISPITKYLHVDLAGSYNMTEKVEGLTLVDCNTIAVVNDNDFGVGGLSFNPATGTFNNYPSASAETPLLGLISVRNNGFDASDRDLTASSGRINIRHWPVLGMYQPDAIAAFSANGQTYYITANEGDARADWPGYSEEIRVGAGGYVLDPAAFPNAAVLKSNANLGRLQLTNATGNTDADAAFEQIHALGARSFSIWNAAGQLVYESGDELEQITAALSDTSFNSDGTAASFDTRSDNKGPEIEAVAIGVVGGVPYAFIGSERTGDIFVYDVGNPLKPVFKEYINTPGELGVEGLSFVPAAASPTGRPLLISSAEVSRTVTVYEVNAPSCSITAIPSNNTYTGGVPTNIYLGYGPQSVTLNVAAQPAAGAPYTYSWTGNGSLSSNTSSSPVFAPTSAGRYTFHATVTSACGITNTCSITICVTDIRVAGHSDKVYICHAPPGNPGNAKTHAIHVSGVGSHLLNHSDDRLGKCAEAPCQPFARMVAGMIQEEVITGMTAEAYPNPSNSDFSIQVNSGSEGPVRIRVSDIRGRTILQREILPGNFRFGRDLESGIYIMELTQGDSRRILKLSRQ